MGWEDSGRRGHIHFADKSIERKGKCEHSSATSELKPRWRQAAPYCIRKMESHLLTSLHCGCRERRLQCFFPSQASNWSGLRWAWGYGWSRGFWQPFWHMILLDYALHGLEKTRCCQKNFLGGSALSMFSQHVFRLLVPSLGNTTG